MATSRKAGDVTLDFRNMDFSTMSEKGLPDPHEQQATKVTGAIWRDRGTEAGARKHFWTVMPAIH